MRTYDEQFNEIAEPDLELGRTEQRERSVTHRWVVDVAEESHEEVIAEYPETGGKDVAIVVDVPEEGHWETTLEDGTAIDFGGIPDDWPHEQAIAGSEQYLLYIPYTEEELAEIAAQREEQRQEAERQKIKEAMADQAIMACSLMLCDAGLTDAQALTVGLLYPEWEAGTDYKVGDIRRYDGELYRSLQDYPSQAEHTPDESVALWKKIEPPSDGGVPPWSQPLGYTDAYMRGDVVEHNGKTWESTVDNNTWEPGVYGWIEKA